MLPLFPHEETDRARAILTRLKQAADMHWEEHDLQRFKVDPYSALLAAMLSPRTKTEDTRAAVRELFTHADTPAAMARLPYEQILALLTRNNVTYPENKAQYVIDLSQKLVDDGGIVPRTLDEITQYPGVGWKVGLLTLWVAYRIAPEICVDVHVARIGKRIGFVTPTTTDPQKVSRQLMDIVPRASWGEWNPIMVYFGKTRCYPVAPDCAQCPIFDLCDRVGVR
jgi:endonuclease III